MRRGGRNHLGVRLSPLPPVSSDLSTAPQLTETILLQPMGKLVLFQPLHCRLPLRLLAYDNRLRVLRQRVDQRIRVRGDDQLASIGRIAQQVRQLREDIGVKTQFRFLQAHERRRRRVAQDRHEAT